jgi:hypothetical protein
MAAIPKIVTESSSEEEILREYEAVQTRINELEVLLEDSKVATSTTPTLKLDSALAANGDLHVYATPPPSTGGSDAWTYNWRITYGKEKEPRIRDTTSLSYYVVKPYKGIPLTIDVKASRGKECYSGSIVWHCPK